MFLSDFLTVYASYRDVRTTTLEQYRWCIEHFSRHLGRKAQLSDLTSSLVNEWLHASSTTYSPHTIKTRRMTMLSLWNLAAELQLAERPRLIRRVKTPVRRIDVLTSDQLRQVIAAANALEGMYNRYRWADLMRTWIIAVTETAMRPGDMQTLEWPDIRQCGGSFVIVQRKTGRLRRVIFSATLLADIASWHSPDGLIWPAGCRHTYGRKLTELGKLLGFKKLTHTQLRKTAITDVERQQPGVGWVFAGHSNPQTTQGWYIAPDKAYANVPRPRLL